MGNWSNLYSGIKEQALKGERMEREKKGVLKDKKRHTPPSNLEKCVENPPDGVFTLASRDLHSR
jgi:hypothetical protein